MSLETSQDKKGLVAKKGTVDLSNKKASIKSGNETSLKTVNISRYNGNANNITVRDLATNRVLKPSSLNKDNKLNNTAKKSKKPGGSGGTEYLRDNVLRRVDNRINKIADERLKTVKLGEEPHIDIGTNTIKSAYNSALKSKHGAETAIKTVKTIKGIPKSTKNILSNVREIPNKIRTAKNNIKGTAITSAKEVYKIGTKLATGKFKEAGKIITKDLIKSSKKTYKVGKNVSKPGLKIAGGAAKSGLNQFKSNFKEAFNKSEGIEDIGSKNISTMVSSSNNIRIVSAKGIKNVRTLNKKIKNTKSRLKTFNNSMSKIKTLKKVDKLKAVISKAKNSFRLVAKVQKLVVKSIKLIISKVIGAVVKAIGALTSNPVALGIIAGAIVLIIFVQLLISMFSGVNGSLTIDFEDNIDAWKQQMAIIDKATDKRIHSGDNLDVKNSSYNTSWKEVLAVYYVKYGDMSLKNDSFVNDGTGMNTSNPKLWNDIYKVLQEQLGKDYVFGADGPDTFDCSGLVEYCYNQFADQTGMTMGRTTYQQCEQGDEVDKDNQDTWQPGDLIFFIGEETPPSHVGIYIGNNQYIHAPQTGDVVKASDLTRTDIYCVRRIIPPSSNTESSSDSNASQLSETIQGSIADIIKEAANKYNVDPNLIAAIIKHESDFQPDVVSSAGAMGLMQLEPDTATSMGVENAFDPYQNVMGGTKLIKQLLDKYSGDLKMALMAYAMGEGAMIQRDITCDDDLYKASAEAQAFIPSLLGMYESYRNGEPIPDMYVTGSTGSSSSVSSKLQKTYNLFNEVTSKTEKYKKDGNSHTRTYYTLTKHSLEEVEETLNMSEDDKELIDGILEYDNFDDFGEDYDFKFKYKY